MNEALISYQCDSKAIPYACDMQAIKGLKPLYHWAGGKTRLLKHYKEIFPDLAKFDDYIEPFFGGGAFFCDVVNKTDINNLVINDINPEIISIYRVIRDEPAAFIKLVEKLSTFWNALKQKDRKAWYYSTREIYQTLEIGNVESASYLYVLMLLSFSGIWRTHKKTQHFYAAMGDVDKQLHIDFDLITTWSRQLQNTKILCGSYQDIVIPEKPSLIFVDPPYRGSDVTYSSSFDDNAQIALIQWCQKMSSLGHTVLLSNLDGGDDFFESRLPANAEIHYIEIKFTAGRNKQNSDGEKPKSREFLIVFSPMLGQAANDDSYEIEANNNRSNLNIKINSEQISNSVKRVLKKTPSVIVPNISQRRALIVKKQTHAP